MNERSRTKVHAKVDKSFEASVPINISRLLSDTVQLKHHKNFSESLVSPDKCLYKCSKTLFAFREWKKYISAG